MKNEIIKDGDILNSSTSGEAIPGRLFPFRAMKGAFTR